jgi:arsenite methyltransferase
MNGLQFTDEAARQLEKAYLTRDVIAQRSETIRHLSLSAGERVLDIGCGPGFLCESMAEIVGPKGSITGIDISADLIARCNGRKTSAHLSYEVADATKLDQPNAAFDVVVCTQVAEYVADVDRVFSEAFRVLKPSGRTVFVVTDWKVFRQFETHGRSHEIVGRAFRPSAPANVDGGQVYQGRISF